MSNKQRRSEVRVTYRGLAVACSLPVTATPARLAFAIGLRPFRQPSVHGQAPCARTKKHMPRQYGLFRPALEYQRFISDFVRSKVRVTDRGLAVACRQPVTVTLARLTEDRAALGRAPSTRKDKHMPRQAEPSPSMCKALQYAPMLQRL